MAALFLGLDPARHRGPVLLTSRAETERGHRQPIAGRRNAIHGVPVTIV